MLKKIMAMVLTLVWVVVALAQSIELNQATEMELDGLKGVGPALTREVLSERQKAPFKDWDDVTQRVKGIGAHKAARLSEQGLRVQGQVFKRPPPSQTTRPPN